MNVIVVMNDTLRRDHIAAYGVQPSWDRLGRDGLPFIETPNLDQLATRSALFDRFYIASYPTVPNRRDLLTGRWGLLETGWEPLLSGDVLLPEVVAQSGIVTQLYFDTLPMGSDGYGFRRGFAGWEWIRGQHSDHLVTAPAAEDIGCPPHQLRGEPERMAQIIRNRHRRRYERDFMAPKTFDAALDWLEDNYRNDNFLLWIDTWDPHEPFDPPAYDYRRYADPAYAGQAITYPQYGRVGHLTAAELNDVRARYAGEVTMVDRCIGRLVDKVHALGLDDRTLMIHMSDHGYLLGEHDLLGKPGDLLGNLYEPTCRVGLMISHPQHWGAGARIGSLAQPPDIMPTILDFLGLPIPPTVQGTSLLPLLSGESRGARDIAVSGRFLYAPRDGVADTAVEFDGMAGAGSEVCARTVTSERWSYICAPYDMRSELYDLDADPHQTHDVIDAHPDVRAELHRAFVAFLDRHADGRGVEPFGRAPTLDASPSPRPDGALAATVLHAMVDHNGCLIATPSRDEAELYARHLPDAAIETTTLGELHRRAPRALVRMRAQFYWAEDLLHGAPRGMTNELKAFTDR